MKRLFSSGDYETMHNVLVLRAGKDETIKAQALVDLAMDAVESGLGAQEALASLRGLNASVKETDLALGLLRLEYFPFELRDANTAWRYLVAVKHARDVDPLTSQQSRLIDRIETLVGLEPDLAYGQLLLLDRRLEDIQQQVRQEHSEWDGRGVRNNGFFRIEQMLTPYLGPESTQSDILLRSRYAFHIARVYLVGLAGLLEKE